jgi:glycosyltransferase involved in cell wall biosynthesis
MKSSRVLLNSSVYFANAYIAISSHLYNKLELLTSRREMVHLIPICVDLKFFSNKLYLHDKNNIKIFYGGSYGQKDGLSYLVAAFDKLSARHDNIHLILSGKGFPSDMDLLFDQISKLRSKEKIIYKGYLDTNDYYSLVNDCDIFCMTRITSKAATTGFPFKLGEFLATGKAVVATNIGEVSRYLKNGHNALLIRSESVDDIVNALQQLVENPDLIETLGTEGRKTAETCFDSDKLSLQVLRIFETI